MYTKPLLLTQLTDAFRGMLSLHEDLIRWTDEFGMKLTEVQFSLLGGYLELLKEKNEVLNLTRITHDRDMWIKHIFDGLMAAPFIARTPRAKVIDLGSGGGIPGIPLAILFPQAQFTLVDSIQKKATALEEFIEKLGLKNVRVIKSRIEPLGQNRVHRESYDVVTARALAPLRVLAELAIPLIRSHGHVVAYKGPDYIHELADARNALGQLKAESPRVYHYSLPEDQGERILMVLTKKCPTPIQYPRKEGLPAKRPL